MFCENTTGESKFKFVPTMDFTRDSRSRVCEEGGLFKRRDLSVLVPEVYRTERAWSREEERLIADLARDPRVKHWKKVAMEFPVSLSSLEPLPRRCPTQVDRGDQPSTCLQSKKRVIYI